MEEIPRKIEETVKEILRTADMEEMTEFKVRAAASERLGIDLSDMEHRRFVRGVVESFLLSTAEETDEAKEADLVLHEQTKEAVREGEEPARTKMEVDGDGNRLICKLSNKRNVMLHEFRGKTYVSIRDFYRKDGKQLPSATGVSLASEDWSAFKKSIPAIEEAIEKMKSKLRSEHGGEQNGHVSKSTVAATHGFVPLETTRFDGKNYHSWAARMELFLKQLKIAYVLTDPPPSATPSTEENEESIEAKAIEQKWMSDEYLCCHCILHALSDTLYQQFSKKTNSAKELWEELKLVYLYEEFGTKRSQVKRYIEFQMVDGKQILEQIQELNTTADSIVAAGMMIDENFHVSAIISKLPPSWKDFSIKLMREEHLPFWMLMDRVRVEEESRNGDKQGEHSKFAGFHPPKNTGPGTRTADMRKPGLQWKRQDAEPHKKALVCSHCGKKGHIAKNCWNRKAEMQNKTTPVFSDTNAVERNVE
ncbi:hypothetical protein SLEP1_g2253 [Rubroshorea leprosula]|uniref:CCHC-type domain-containing protein n=1 Tax=Rubroshorea leprosula TaxID=152421 RepID=A0AAV5HKY8_9ROSI|nr:hypothetical protein SLEP1_g2253 [Rubroshorea leprosula]